MKKYKILKTVSGVKPGELHPVLFEKDSEHHIDDDLASQLYDQGAIDLIEDADSEQNSDEKTDEKSRGAAPSNKNKAAAPVNKGKAAD